jgi:hypothetical protein
MKFRVPPASIRLALCFLLVCTNFPERASAQAKRSHSQEKCTPTSDSQILKMRENELRATGEQLLQAFRDKDTTTFLALVHPQYFGMGAEGKNYTRAELKESFRKKDELYCYLFDASCIAPAPPPDTPETSFSEVAKRSEATVQSVQIWAGKDIKEPGCRGSVNFAWVDPVDSAHVSTFTFMYVDGQWKTVGFDFPPTAMPKPI